MPRPQVPMEIESIDGSHGNGRRQAQGQGMATLLWCLWVYRLTLLEAGAIGLAGLSGCRGRGWTARTDKLRNGLRQVIKHHALHGHPLCWDHASNFWFELHHLHQLHVGAEHLPIWVQLHRHLWLRHSAHYHLSLSLSVMLFNSKSEFMGLIRFMLENSLRYIYIYIYIYIFFF
jgi:hypothetical protein